MAPRSDSERSFLCLSPRVSTSGQPSVAVCWLGKAAFGSLHNPNFLHRSWDKVRNECRALRVNIRHGLRDCDSPGLTTRLVEDLESSSTKLSHGRSYTEHLREAANGCRAAPSLAQSGLRQTTLDIHLASPSPSTLTGAPASTVVGTLHIEPFVPSLIICRRYERRFSQCAPRPTLHK